jgi:carbon-monoxide dehydrogenase large subunit
LAHLKNRPIANAGHAQKRSLIEQSSGSDHIGKTSNRSTDGGSARDEAGENMSMIGTRVVRREDPALLTGASLYVDDVRLEGEAFVAFARSTEPHARVRGVDVSEAEAMPGVIVVHIAATLGAADRPPLLPDIDAVFARPLLARDVVRFVGEPVAVVIAETREQALDAAEAIIVDYDPLPVVLDPEESLTSEVLLFEGAPSNAMLTLAPTTDEDVLDGADVVVRARITNHRMAPAPIEGRTITAHWDGERMTVWASTQGAFDLRMIVAYLLSLDPSLVRVRYRDVGGGFGAKGLPHAEELTVVWLARQVGRPLRWAETRTENLLAMGHARGQVHDLAIGATRDGRIVGLDVRVVQDGGGYPHTAIFLPRLTGLMASGVYNIPKVRFEAVVAATNTNPVGAFRGAGRPEAAFAIERAVELLAAELGMDAVALRRKNFYAPGDFPLTTACGAPYDSGDYATALDKVLAALDYDGLRAEQAKRRANGTTQLLGVGLAVYVEITNVSPTGDAADLRLRADGTLEVRTGSAPQGQGHLTTWAMLASDRLGIPLDRIEVLCGDTDTMPVGAGVGGSRSAQALGSTVVEAAGELIATAREHAARLLEADPADVLLDAERGVFHVVGAPAIARSWDELAGAVPEPLSASASNEGRPPTFPFGAHAAVVEVDADTGATRVVRFVAIDDCGTVVNPLIAEGQVHGGIASGIAHALFEHIVYSEDGIPLTTTFAEYGIPSAAELPSFETIDMETPSPMNPLGAKGIGESGTIGAMPAVANAVIDAVSHLGIRHIDTPLTPMRVWAAIQAAATA